MQSCRFRCFSFFHAALPRRGCQASDAAEQQKLCQLSGSATSTNQLWALGFRKRMQMYLQRVSVYVWRLHEAIWQYFSTHAAGNTGLQSTNSCGLESPQTVPLAMDGLFTDPNCTQSSAWATWLAGLGTLTLGAGAAEPGFPEALQQSTGLSSAGLDLAWTWL